MTLRMVNVKDEKHAELWCEGPHHFTCCLCYYWFSPVWSWSSFLQGCTAGWCAMSAGTSIPFQQSCFTFQLVPVLQVLAFALVEFLGVSVRSSHCPYLLNVLFYVSPESSRHLSRKWKINLLSFSWSLMFLCILFPLQSTLLLFYFLFWLNFTDL